MNRIGLLAKLRPALGQHRLRRERGDWRCAIEVSAHEANTCATRRRLELQGAFDAEMQADAADRNRLGNGLSHQSAGELSERPTSRSSARISDGSRNIAACARNASR